MVVNYVHDNFPYGFRNKHNPQTKRSVFEAISVGVWLALSDNVAPRSLNKSYVREQITSYNFTKNTNVANQLHKQDKLKGRIDFIYNMIKAAGEEK